jgi:ABC-type transport system involved in cytochrome c biogenesis permease subunit
MFLSINTLGQKTVSKQTADAFSRLAVEYNGRISTIGTLARDFTQKITGKTEYNNYNAVQVFCGWLFFPQDWENEPMIHLKNKAIQKKLGVKNRLALTDFFYPEGAYRLPYLGLEMTDKSVVEADEKVNIILDVQRGRCLKIFPYNNKWLSLDDRLEDVQSEDTIFIANIIPLLAEQIYEGNEIEIQQIITKIAKFQTQRVNSKISVAKIKMETAYNKLNIVDIIFKINIIIALIAFIDLMFARIKSRKHNRIIKFLVALTVIVSFLWLTVMLVFRGWISGHLPMSNGYETMMFSSWIILLLSLILHKQEVFFTGGLFISGIALLVCYLSGLNPQMTNLVPVLQSPLLSIHVSLIIISYSLLAFLTFNSIISLLLKVITKEYIHDLKLTKTILLIAVLLLGCGIFVGAIWANNAWGRYWGWDPKEVWALITFLVYGIALYDKRLPFFREPFIFHIYMLLAFLTVLMTYFGVSIFLGGIHSY